MINEVDDSIHKKQTEISYIWINVLSDGTIDKTKVYRYYFVFVLIISKVRLSRLLSCC